MNLQISDGAKAILARLKTAGYTAYIAGGAVRDLIMGNTPHDYDIATNAHPEEIKSIFAKTIELFHQMTVAFRNQRILRR